MKILIKNLYQKKQSKKGKELEINKGAQARTSYIIQLILYKLYNTSYITQVILFKL